MGNKHPMSLNSSHFIEPHNYYYPFSLSCTTDLSSTLSPTQTTNHPLVTLLILIIHTPPTSSPYQPLTFHVNVGSQPHTFPNPFDHAQLRHFSSPTILVLTIGHDHTPISTRPQLPPKVLCPTCEHQFINRRLVRHNVPIKHPIYPIQTFVIIPT
jgi:hypothetical protein